MLLRRLMIPAVAVALALSLGLTAIGFWAGRTIVQIMSDRLINEMTQGVSRDVAHIVGGVDRALSGVANDLVRHDVALGDPITVARELYGLLTVQRDVDWLYFGNEAGGLVSVGRLPDGKTVFLMTDGFRAGIIRQFEALRGGGIGRLIKSEAVFDTRQKVWYSRAKETSKPYWTDLYLGVEPIAGVSLSTPVLDKHGSFAGVAGTDLILTQLASLMRTLHLGEHGRTFLVDTAGRLISSSGGVLPVRVHADGNQSLLNASETDDPVVGSAARYLSSHPEIVERTSAGLQTVSFDVPALGAIYAAVGRFQAAGGIDWIIVSALPAEDFLGPVQRATYFSLAIGAAIVVAALLLGLWAIGGALRPLTALTNATQAIARGEWRDVPKTRRNDEVGVLADAFSVMATRLKKTLDGLRDSEAKLEEAQRIAHLGYWDRNLDTDLLTWSDETYRIHGLAPQERTVTIAASSELVHPEDRQIVNETMAEALRGGPPYDLEYRVVRPNGEVHVVHSHGDVTRDESGQPRRVFGTLQDITERKRADDNLHDSERRYREAQMELEHAHRVTTMGQLSATIAHEVSQPIAATVTYASAALRWLAFQPPNLEEVRLALGGILESGNRAGDVVGRIRALMKRAPPRKDRLGINETILEVIALTRGELEKHGISLRTQLAEGLPLLEGDRVQLQQVILNLIMNAVEAMSGVGEGARELLISTARSEPDGMLVTVRDTGPALAPANRERLFEAFYSTKPGGLGMGLSICRSIVEDHGGRMWVSANIPQGAIFQFTLPAHPDSASI